MIGSWRKENWEDSEKRVWSDFIYLTINRLDNLLRPDQTCFEASFRVIDRMMIQNPGQQQDEWLKYALWPSET